MCFKGRFKDSNIYLMFVDPCIIVSLIQKNPKKMQECIKIYYSIFT
jgi:hypothetical protein